MRNLLILACAAAAVGLMATGPEDKAKEKSAEKKEAAKAAPSKADAAWEKMKSLVGNWETADADKDGKPDATVTYRLTSGGSALHETLFPGTESEMVTMYYKDGDSLGCTHYCMLANQPQLSAKPGKDANVLHFEFVRGTNMKSKKDDHMGDLVVTFVDSDHFKQKWTGYKDGKESEGFSPEWTRKK